MTEKESNDIKLIAELPYPWEKLSGKTIVVSGGSGFLGSFFCNIIRYRNLIYGQNIRVLSITRRGGECDDTVYSIKHNICQKIDISERVDYILHLASNTHPAQYRDDPVGTITANVFGTYHLLNVAKENPNCRFMLASSCEIYGNGTEQPMDESYCGYIDCNTARAGYNESKRVSESLCQSFRQQYGTDIVIARLARVFGIDTTKKDTKAMAQFIEKAVNRENIILKSKGLQRYSFVYIADAVSGIIKVMLDGLTGEAYNVTDDDEGMTLGEYAEFIAKIVGTHVVYDINDNPDASRAQYALLDNSKIKSIGFVPMFSVKEEIQKELLSGDMNNYMLGVL